MKRALLVCLLVMWAASEVVLPASAAPDAGTAVNLAVVAAASTSYVSGHETLAAINDGFDPAHSNDHRHGAYGNWPRTGTQWVQYDWGQPIRTNKIDVYWFDDHRGVRLPRACRLLTWEGGRFVAVPGASGLGVEGNKYNTTTFPEITTSRFRLEFDGNGRSSTGILEWKVYDSGKSPDFPPIVKAGVDRVVVLPGKTYLNGTVQTVRKAGGKVKTAWSRESGPGGVTFADASSPVTTATFTAPGEYVLRLTATAGRLSASDTLRVRAEPPPPATHLGRVETARYKVSSPFWRPRLKGVIVHWIPHCIRKIDDPHLREGGIENFVQAGNKLAGRPAARHVGYPFSNAWVYNTVEAMSLALLVDPQGDPDIARAQDAMRAKLDEWIPIILAAQEPDGYLQTFHTLSGRRHWSNKGDHEGYVAGYFIEAALAHYLMTGKKDARLYRAARKLADCWCAHLGPPPKQYWYDGHEEMEQALVRLARFVDEDEGAGKGKKYLDLAKFLLDSRRNGEEYDQSHVPVTHQYEAVGHAVRAVYCYAAMTDVAMETGDADYESAVRSLDSDLVDRKYYVTGGVGSGETAEGFGKDYSLPNWAYCESCADCGELFFQHRLNLTYQDTRYADRCEETLYNAVLGSLDLDGRNFTYTNPLEGRDARYGWHVCPCCVGNIARTLLRLPTWMYAKGPDTLAVNLFAGSTVNVGDVAGVNVEVVQATDYPWSGRVAITVNPRAAREFTFEVRVPSRKTSRLYTATPECEGLTSLAVNGKAVEPKVVHGYVALTRTWKAGDRIDLVLPLAVQRVKASDKVVADRGRVALRYGPLVYDVESVDQDVDQVLRPTAPLSAKWEPGLLGGVVAIHGTFANGARLTAIPNYARNNRGGRSVVWLKDR
ncbi:MAG TPA: beta-L-arabinofuranosidase domain-containing protein [Gemmataceae bacterium]|nr:beta-L-arabinofuranosidase domain-containing protein [Gemmataceae bacterium]